MKEVRRFAEVAIQELASMIFKATMENGHYDEDDFSKENEKGHIYPPVELIEKNAYYVNWQELGTMVKLDMEKCSFDTENVNMDKTYMDESCHCIMGFHNMEIEGQNFTFAGVEAGGDWEEPIFFIIYADDQGLRAYIPTAGNPWNTQINEAYGNDDESDQVNIRIRMDEVDNPSSKEITSCNTTDARPYASLIFDANKIQTEIFDTFSNTKDIELIEKSELHDPNMDRRTCSHCGFANNYLRGSRVPYKCSRCNGHTLSKEDVENGLDILWAYTVQMEGQAKETDALNRHMVSQTFDFFNRIGYSDQRPRWEK